MGPLLSQQVAQAKSRSITKAEANLKAKIDAELMKVSASQPVVNDEEILKIFSTGEKVERTPRGTKPNEQPVSEGKKKKKGKK